VILSNLKHAIRTNFKIYQTISIFRVLQVLKFIVIGLKLNAFDKIKFLQKAKSLYYRMAYESYFFKLDLLKAYSFRYKHLLSIITGELKDNHEQAKNYIDHAWNNDFINLIKLNNTERSHFTEFIKSNNEISSPPRNNYIDRNVKVLIAGPLFNFIIADDYHFNYILVNKPPPDEFINLFEGKILVITGTEWALSNQKLIKTLKETYNNISFFSVAKTKETASPNALSSYPLFPFGACIMNLQRTLHASRLLFLDSFFVVDGYDFVLSKQIHNKWYSKNAMNIGENPLWSLGRHDYFLSYLYSRNFFIDNTNYSGPTVDIAKEDLNKILKEFKDVYRSKRAIL
tara:strand:+ start:488 stop:1516 length:1029 start_codon:yes stop_codon:yes gene_type:complete